MNEIEAKFGEAEKSALQWKRRGKGKVMREFTDAAGSVCRVWAVYPQPPASQPYGAPYVGLQAGWLCFDCGDERRRLAPIPAGWETAPDSELVSLWTVAAVVATRQVERATRAWWGTWRGQGG